MVDETKETEGRPELEKGNTKEREVLVEPTGVEWTYFL